VWKDNNDNIIANLEKKKVDDLFVLLKSFHVANSSLARENNLWIQMYDYKFTSLGFQRCYDPKEEKFIDVPSKSLDHVATCVQCGHRGAYQVDHQIALGTAGAVPGAVAKCLRVFGMTEDGGIGYKYQWMHEHMDSGFSGKFRINGTDIGLEDLQREHFTEKYVWYFMSKSESKDTGYLNFRTTGVNRPTAEIRGKKLTRALEKKKNRYTLNNHGVIAFSVIKHNAESNNRMWQALFLNNILNYAPRCANCNGSEKNSVEKYLDFREPRLPRPRARHR
jgi:hypothetical protein